jgi:microcystin-dependent protein
MATYGHTFTSGDTLTPPKLNDARTVTDIVDADISASAAIALSKLATGALPTAITVASANLVDGTVTVDDLAAGTVERLLPAGAVMAFAMNSAPDGWLPANGGAVSRTNYAALFAAIGTTHGVGNGSTTFNVPDLRGIFVRGSGDQTISGTAYSKAFALKETDSFRAHTHDLGSRVNAAAFGIGIVAASNSATINGNNNPTESTGGTETRPANLALLYCIKF